MGPTLTHRLRVEAHAVWLAIRAPDTPWAARIVGLLVAAYALSPIDLIPDFIPVLGLVDDAVVIPAGLWLFRRLIPEAQFTRHRAAAEAASERPSSKLGIVMIIAIWIAAVWLIWWVVRVNWD
jgi:uncharacterized membrane protein YkvA (DUF1232 family)